MNILIVEPNPDLGRVWSNHLERLGAVVFRAVTGENAYGLLQGNAFDLILLDLDLTTGGALSIADYANYRCPKTRVIFVTASSFFSDGSIFNFSSNACALVRADTRPEDLAALVEHHTREIA